MLNIYNTLSKYNISKNGILHVGMHEAEEYHIYKQLGFKNIAYVEANEQYVKARKNIDDDCHVIHAAVSDVVETVEFKITNNGQSSSILDLHDHSAVYPTIVNIGSVTMRTQTLDSVIEQIGLGVQAFNVLALDIQGAEFKAINGITNWQYIQAILAEVNYREMYKGCTLEPEFTQFLLERGYCKVEESDTYAGWGEAFYVKNSLL